MGFPWDSYGVPMKFLWEFYWISCGSDAISMGFLRDFCGMSMVFIPDFYDMSK